MTARTGRKLTRGYPVTAVSGTRSERTVCRFSWTDEDPVAIKLTIDDPWEPGREVDWVFARATLVGACLPPMTNCWVGGGDVSVCHSGATTQIRFSPPEGECVLIMRGEVPLDFLRALQALMPLGAPEEAEIYAAQIDREWPAIAGGGS
jgi:hypothetical protein